MSIHFVTDLPDSGDGMNSIMKVIDRATRMIHVIHCSKSISTAETARLFMRYIVRLHGVPRAIYIDRCAQFI